MSEVAEVSYSEPMWVRFLVYGIFGWCTEIVWTATTDAVEARLAGERVDPRLAGKTYLWMFPIYAFGGLLFELGHGWVAALAWPLRGVVYTIGIFAVEYVSGRLIQVATGEIPWDYSDRRWNVHGLIRLDYAPAWFVFGLLLEQVEGLARVIEVALLAA